jgi:hypothetical protein
MGESAKRLSNAPAPTVPDDTLYLLDELRIYQIELEMQNDLKESRALLRAL